MLSEIDQMRAFLAAWTAPLLRRVGGDRGQTAAEYIGVIAMIVFIVAFLVSQGQNIGQVIVDGVKTMIGKVVEKGG